MTRKIGQNRPAKPQSQTQWLTTARCRPGACGHTLPRKRLVLVFDPGWSALELEQLARGLFLVSGQYHSGLIVCGEPRGRPPADPLVVIGIDDFAWRRNHRYGTIICDLERRRTVALLADRERATAEDWLRGHPDIAVVARHRGGGYGEAIAKALPDAI